MPIKQILNEKVPVKIWSDKVEESALKQLKNVAALPFVFKHVAVMPDVHMGSGACVGSVVATKGAVCPAAVGVDIGCGMAAAKIKGLKLIHIENKLKELRHEIERSIPVGFNLNKTIKEDALNWKWDLFESIHQKAHGLKEKAMKQMGTLGGGNHFIEICLDTVGDVWVMLHSGSRNLGKSVADIHINEAKNLMKKMFIELPDPDLAYLAMGTPEFKNYMHDLLFCQDYALYNREVMMRRIIYQIGRLLKINPEIEQLINCHHNFAIMENHFGENVLITRKGAVRARIGDMGIIPGSMGTKSYIVKGLGNKESFESCSHGAGRAMSRNEARKKFSLEDFKKQTEGVECRKEEELIDEIPGAYKPIEEVMANQSDLVEIVAELKQVLCIKG